MVNVFDFLQFDANLHNEKWIGDRVSEYRTLWRPIIDIKKSNRNMALLLGEPNMEQVKKLFKNPDDTNVDFTVKVKLMEKIRNILIADMESTGINFNLNAIDPTASNQRKKDKELLTYKGVIESFINYYAKSIGLPPFSITDNDKDGNPIVNGNIEDFDAMGLDNKSSEDIEFFMSQFHRLSHEIKLAEPISYFIRYNELQRDLPLYCNDILAKKAIAMRTYVNQSTGAIDIKYLPPELVKVAHAKRLDCKDALARGYEQNLSITEFLRLVGTDFNMETDWNHLLSAVNTVSNDYTGIQFGNKTYGEDGRVITPGQYSNLIVGVGYMEFRAIESDAYSLTQSNYHGNRKMYRMPLDKELKPNSKSEKEVYHNEVIYCTYYLDTGGPGSQKCYKFGKLPYQMLKGANDEFATGSIIIARDIGPTAVEIAEPHINKYLKMNAKQEWLINKAKPPSRSYNLDTILEVAKAIVGSGNKQADVISVLKMFNDSEYELHTNPTVDGKSAGGGGLPHYEIPNGMSKDVIELSNLLDKCVADILRDVGISPIMDVQAPSPRESYNLNIQTLNYSRKATQYVSRMLTNLFGEGATITLSYVQSIIKYKSVRSRPYEFLMDALGQQTVDDIKALDAVCMHRYGIFVQPFNSIYEKQEVMLLAQQQLQGGYIQMEDYLLLQSIENPKRAAMVLAYQKKRNERVARELEMQKMEVQDQMDHNKFERQMQLEQLKGKNMIEAKRVEGEYYMKGHVLAAEERTKQTVLKIDAEEDKIEQKTNASIRENQATEN